MRPRRSATESEGFRPISCCTERQDRGGHELGRRQDGWLSREIQREKQSNDGTFQGIPSTGMSRPPPRELCDLTGRLPQGKYSGILSNLVITK